MCKRLVDADSLGRVQHEDFLQEILQLVDLPQLVLGEPLEPNQVTQEVLRGGNRAQDGYLLLWGKKIILVYGVYDVLKGYLSIHLKQIINLKLEKQ